MPTKTTKAIIRPRLLRYWVCLRLQAANEPMRISELVAAFELSPYEVRGRTSKAISDTVRWAIPRGWVSSMGRGRLRPGRIPDSTARYMRNKLEAAAAGGDPSWYKTQERKLEGALAMTRGAARSRSGALGDCRYDAAPAEGARLAGRGPLIPGPGAWRPLSL